MMKIVAILMAFLAASKAFAPLSVNGRTSTAVNALFDDVSSIGCLGEAVGKILCIFEHDVSNAILLRLYIIDRQHGSLRPQEGPKRLRCPSQEERTLSLVVPTLRMVIVR